MRMRSPRLLARSSPRVRSRGAYGTPIGCSQLDVYMSNLAQSIAAAVAAGVTTTNLSVAQNWYSQQTTWYSQDWFDLGSSCQNAVATTQTYQANLDADTRAAGGAPPANQPAPTVPPGGLSGLLGLPDWALPVGASVLGVGVLAWLVSSLAKFRRRPA